MRLIITTFFLPSARFKAPDSSMALMLSAAAFCQSRGSMELIVVRSSSDPISIMRAVVPQEVIRTSISVKKINFGIKASPP